MQPPMEWPTRLKDCRRSRLRKASRKEAVSGRAYEKPSKSSESPKPGKSGAMARKRGAKAFILKSHSLRELFQPCRRMVGNPFPRSSNTMRAPLTRTSGKTRPPLAYDCTHRFLRVIFLNQDCGNNPLIFVIRIPAFTEA